MDSATQITDDIKAFARSSSSNRMPASESEYIFDEPLVQFINGDDDIFTEYKDIIDTFHLTPREALTKAYDEKTDNIPDNITVISWILPITEKTRKSNRKETRLPSRLWSHTRWFGEIFNDAIR